MSKGPVKLPHVLRVAESTPLGQGGMATIYRAYQQSLDRVVVIKRIKPELLAHPTVVQRFEREAKASAKLLHQNLAHVYDYVTDDGPPYIVMEYVDGVDVADILSRRGKIPLAPALAIIYGVTRALYYIHGSGLIHRDLKPENIRISSRGDVKLMDFGIALQAEDAKLTLPGVIIGSPHYLSPEQVLGEKIDHRADLFSLGITLYELLTGKRPFDSNNNETVFHNIRLGKFIPANKLDRSIPSDVNALINKLLERNPNRRIHSAHEAHRLIRRISGIDDEKTLLRKYLVHECFVTADPGEKPHMPMLPKRKSRLTLIAEILALAVVAFVLGFMVQNLRQKMPEETTLSPPTVSNQASLNEFCAASAEEAAAYTPMAREKVDRAMRSAKIKMNGFPAFDLIRFDGAHLARARDRFKSLSNNERELVLEINGARSEQTLFQRKNGIFPRKPPCAQR